MSRLVALALAAGALGCAGGARTPPSADPRDEPPPLVDATPEPAPDGVEPIEPEPVGGLADPVELPEPAADVELACAIVDELVAAGDHKPAVDSLAGVVAGGGVCETRTLAAVEDSRRRLAEADALVRRGLEARSSGDVAAARASFEAALERYPRYYWVQRLVADLPAEPDRNGEETLRQAARLRAAGRAEEALALLGSVEQDGQAVDPRVAAEISGLRTEIGDLRLGAAHREQRAGNLEGAVELTHSAIDAAPGDPVRAQVIDLARRLGLNLFSAGELREARSLWRAALSLDPDNQLLRRYLDEVEARLRSLDDIKDRDDG